MNNAIVLGSGRSGTSMLAGAIAGTGCFVGDDPYPGRESNPKGFFEAHDVNGINEWLIASVESRGSGLGAWQRWLSVLPVGTRFAPKPEIVARMRTLTARRPFCFKDPRFCYTLPAWREALRDARFLVVFRDPAATANSMVEECKRAAYLRGLAFDFERGVDVWSAMYRHVLDVHRHDGRWMFLHYDQVLTSAGQDRIEKFLETKIARNFPEERLRRSRCTTPVNEEAERIYRDLCQLAGHAGEKIAVRPTTRAPAPIVSDAREPEMSVILCTYNRRAVLEESIASFESQTAAPGSFEFIVVDDGSTDATHEWLSARGLRVPGRIVRRENGGLSAARNSGIAVARGKRLLLVNDDTIAFPDLIEQHLTAYRELGDEKVSILGTFEQPARALDNALMRMLERSTEVFCYASMKPQRFHDWTRFWTCNISVSHALVREVGGFDESFRHYGCEDTDLALRLDARGSRVWFHDGARAHHRHLLDFDALERRQLTVARAWVRLFKKHPRALEHSDWKWVRALDLRECQRYADSRNPDLYGIERAARALSVLDAGALQGHPAANAAADAIVAQLRALIAELNHVWWRQGFAAGLVEHGLTAFAEMLPLEPWPLATSAENAVIAWPEWKATELEHLLCTYGQSLADRDDVCLVLRHDAKCDPRLDLARAALVEAYESVFEPTTVLQVLVLDDALQPADLARVGRSVRAALALPSSANETRASWLRALNVAQASTRTELEKHIGAPVPATT